MNKTALFRRKHTFFKFGQNYTDEYKKMKREMKKKELLAFTSRIFFFLQMKVVGVLPTT